MNRTLRFSMGFALVVIFFLVLCAAIPFGSVARADEEDLFPTGIDLGEYDASIEYHKYTLSGNGYYFSFRVTFDDELFRMSGSVDETMVFHPSEVFDEWIVLFKKNGFTVSSNGKQDGKFVAAKKYASSTDLYIENGYTGYDDPDAGGKKRKGFLFTESERETENPFVNIEKEGTYIYNLFDRLTYVGADENRIKLVYVYGTPYQIVKTNADRVEYQESSSLYLHIFETTKESVDKKIVIKQRSPNPTGWYVIAFLCAAVITAIPLAIMIKRKKGGMYA